MNRIAGLNVCHQQESKCWLESYYSFARIEQPHKFLVSLGYRLFLSLIWDKVGWPDGATDGRTSQDGWEGGRDRGREGERERQREEGGREGGREGGSE